MQRGWGQMAGEIDERTRKCASDDLDSSSTKMQLDVIFEAGIAISLPRKANGCRIQAIADCVLVSDMLCVTGRSLGGCCSAI